MHARFTFASILLAASVGCGGSKPATTSTRPASAGLLEVATRANPDFGDESDDEGYGGFGYGGFVYGGSGYGGDPCGGDPCAWAPPPRPTPPDDPPELAAYLPASVGKFTPVDPAAVYSVPLHDSPTQGPHSALVTVVTTYEFRDPYSNKLRPLWPELARAYGSQARFVWKHFIVHRDYAQVAALGACAAAKQGKFAAFFEAMMSSVFDGARSMQTDLATVKTVAAKVGLDGARFDADLRSAACRDEVIRDQQQFERIGQGAVPVTYINGRVLQGAQPIEAFRTLIDEELAKAKAAVAKGARASTYYDSLVKSGKTAP